MLRNRFSILVIAVFFVLTACQKEAPVDLKNQASSSEKSINSIKKGMPMNTELTEEHLEQLREILAKVKSIAGNNYNINADIAFRNNSFYLKKESIEKFDKSMDPDNIEYVSGDYEKFLQRRKEYRKFAKEYNHKDKKQIFVVAKKYGLMDFELIKCPNDDIQCMAKAIMESFKVKSKNCSKENCNKIEVTFTFITVDRYREIF